MERRLAAILAADVVGYSRLMEIDEAGTFERLRAARIELFELEIEKHRGRIFKLMGDGLLAEFGSAVDAVECAVALQRGMAERNRETPEDRRIEVRIGLNLGEVILDADDRYGEGVNVAARLQQLAAPGDIYLSGKIAREVERRLAVGLEFLGERKMKNLADPVQVYRVAMNRGSRAVATAHPRVRTRTRLAVLCGLLLLALAGIAAVLHPWQPDGEKAETVALPLPDVPSIAVLPFANLSDDPQQGYFADGMAEDLMTDLSRVPGLFVISRHSAFAYRGRDVDVRTVGAELGVRYIIEGSVRRTGEAIRINIQLIDASTGGHEWAERYDGSMGDIFALQDRVTKAVVEALSLRLTSDEAVALAGRNETGKPDAYDEFLRGWELYQRTTSADFIKAIPYFARAVALDPAYGRAHAALAMIYFHAYDQGWTSSLGLTADDAFRQAREHLGLANAAPTSTSYQVAGNISRSRGWYADAEKEFRAAIALDPSDAWSYAYLAYALVYAGKPAEAAAQIDMAMRLDPHYPPLFVFYKGLAQFEQNRMEEAALTLETFTRLNPDDPWAALFLVASYGHLGRHAESARTLAALNAARVREGGVPFVVYELQRAVPSFVPPPNSPLIRGLQRVGVASDFDAREFDALRLTGREIEALFFGHRVHGRTVPGGWEYGASVAVDGTAVTFGEWGFGARTATIEDNRLCFVSTTTTSCGQVLRNPGGTHAKENEYLWFLGWGVMPFSQVE
jgi:TolB-like protein/class 3 adenylate cyclase/Flp pilus assembly protein TadD